MGTADHALFTNPELRALLQREEGQFLEFKSLWDLSGDSRRVLGRRQARDIVAEYVAAFANADGGTLLLGVEDDGTPSGHGYPAEALADLLAVPERRLRPAVRCRTQRISLDGHEILIVQVPIAAEAVMVEANGFPYRVGDRVVRGVRERGARKYARSANAMNAMAFAHTRGEAGVLARRVPVRSRSLGRGSESA